MRYHLESTLPIHAFQPLVKHSPFKHRMTLEGGGGGGIVSAITDPISSALGTDGGGGGILGGLAEFDKGVSNVIPGGWGTIGTAVATYFGGPLGAAAAQGIEGAVKGEDFNKTLQDMAIAAGTAYVSQGLSSGAEAAPVTDYSTLSDAALQESLEQAIQLPTESLYVDMPDTGTLLTPDSVYAPSATPNTVPDFDADVTASAQPSVDVIPPELNLGNLYQDMPDGATQLGYSPEVLASSTQPTLSPEEELRRMYEANINDLGAGTSPYGEANELSSVNESAKDPFRNPSTNFLENPKDYLADKSLQLQFKAEDTLDYLKNAPENAYKYLRDTPIKEMGSDLYDFAGRNKLELGLGALALSSMGGQQPQPSPAGYSSEYSPYTGGYGSSGGVASPYLLRNRVTASNVYDYENPFDRYATVNRRYAKGGEVKHFAFGGISNALTRFTQPIEKAIVQPVGQALPFLKDVAPYAGILAAPFITNPAMAVGVGALSSGFGRPGTGFDMKRALMGGIAAYGASTLGAGVEAAGTEPTKPLVDTLAESYAVPGTEVPVSTAAPKGFFRDTDAMQRGVGNLLSSDSDAATKAFSTKAGTFKSGVPLVMGTSGMMAIDEANKMKEEAEIAAGPARQEQADMLARISKGRKRAEQAVRENPYMYAMGGQVDDELGGDYSAMGMDQGNMQKGLFGMGYKEGGNVSKKSTRLEDNLPELNDNFKETDFEKRLEPSIFRLTGAPNSLIDNPYVKGITGRVGGSYVVDRDTQLTAGLGGFAGRNPSGYTIKPESADVGIVRKMGPGYLAAQYQRNLMGNRAGDRIMANYAIPFAEGGTPRFLSGGGDGMSDSIPATIEGKQEARLADGEFVIPADVVSHLGNGSSKAGAKQLYSMMDRVRKARTGNEKQGRQIKPNKMMPA